MSRDHLMGYAPAAVPAAEVADMGEWYEPNEWGLSDPWPLGYPSSRREEHEARRRACLREGSKIVDFNQGDHMPSDDVLKRSAMAYQSEREAVHRERAAAAVAAHEEWKRQQAARRGGLVPYVAPVTPCPDDMEEVTMRVPRVPRQTAALLLPEPVFPKPLPPGASTDSQAAKNWEALIAGKERREKIAALLAQRVGELAQTCTGAPVGQIAATYGASLPPAEQVEAFASLFQHVAESSPVLPAAAPSDEQVF